MIVQVYIYNQSVSQPVSQSTLCNLNLFCSLEIG